MVFLLKMNLFLHESEFVCSALTLEYYFVISSEFKRASASLAFNFINESGCFLWTVRIESGLYMAACDES